ncbi:MAG: hypothetical protein H6822_11440 [Planctomycetaceae bacterium]|nr:hypothetical protein [Planctomycetaceae bacterium]
MNARFVLLVVTVVVIAQTLLSISEVSASGPVIARGAEREAIKSQHILDRPYRPGHFYGNTVRRRHARGHNR